MKNWTATALIMGVAIMTISTLGTQAAERRSADEALEHYFAAWNEPDEAKRADHLNACWAESATYTDPTADVHGRDALVKHIGGFLSAPQFKGFSIVRISGIDEHHDVFRFEWEMRNPHGEPVTKGMDYGEIDADGNITKIVGFFGPFPEMKLRAYSFERKIKPGDV